MNTQTTYTPAGIKLHGVITGTYIPGHTTSASDMNTWRPSLSQDKFLCCTSFSRGNESLLGSSVNCLFYVLIVIIHYCIIFMSTQTYVGRGVKHLCRLFQSVKKTMIFYQKSSFFTPREESWSKAKFILNSCECFAKMKDPLSSSFIC